MGNIYRNKINIKQTGKETSLHYILPARQFHSALNATNEGHPCITSAQMQSHSLFAVWRSIADNKDTPKPAINAKEPPTRPCETFHRDVTSAATTNTGCQTVIPPQTIAEPTLPAYLFAPFPPEKSTDRDGLDTTPPDIQANSWALPQNRHMSAGQFDANWQYQRPCAVDNHPFSTAISPGLLPHPSDRRYKSGSKPSIPATPDTPTRLLAGPEASKSAEHADAQPDHAPQNYAATMAPNFWPLWIAQRDNLLRQCLKLMSGNMDDAQDALSEAMIKASVKFEDSMDEIRNHRAWLSRIVHNACIDLHRQNRRKAEYHEDAHNSEDDSLPSISRRDVATPEQNALTGEMFDNLERALSDLPEKLRRPLLMRCVQDQTYDEIAENLGLTNCAVRKRVQLARDHLKGCDIR